MALMMPRWGAPDNGPVGHGKEASLTPLPTSDNLASMDLKALLLCGGKGKRMRSALPKVLHPLLGRPMVQWVLEALVPLGPSEVLVVSSPEPSLLEFFEDRGLKVFVQEQPLGTGHAVMAARGGLEGFPGDVLILYGDTPLLRPDTLEGLLAHHRRTGAVLTLLSAKPDDPKGYGRILRDPEGRPLRIVEEADLEGEGPEEINAGVYAVKAPFLLEALGELRPDNRQGEYYLTDIVEVASRRGLPVEVFPCPDPTEVMGINTRLDLAKAQEVLRRRVLEGWMLQGVTVEDPATTWVEPEVRIGRDTVIRPHTFLRGRTVVGEGCVIGPVVEVLDSEIGDGARVGFCCHIEGAVIGPGASVGPFSRLRPGTVLEEEVRIGNFVEVKNSRLGRGTKANHLAYIGDAEVGEEVNIGAGAITCNYDGKRKHRTVIGPRAFIGSNVSLVAPVTVGEGATVGAGSVITKDVPSDSLAVERAKQRVVPNWSRRRK